MIINVYCGTITQHGLEQVDDSARIQDVLDTMRTKYNVDYTRGTINLNGSVLTSAEYAKTFREMGISEECSLVHSPKADGGRV